MNRITIFIGLIGFISACNPSGKALKSKEFPSNVDEVKIEKPSLPIYNESRKRVHDLIHTKLDVRLDFEKAQLKGNALLTLTPYFYPANILELDAKGMEIYQVVLHTDEGQEELRYDYREDVLSINLNKTYSRKDTFKISIGYLSKPNERIEKGSAAITSDKGLYFINPDGESPGKPVQVWTQGETESNSVWFPTIDAPNERMSQELFITVPEKFVTLSNGNLIFSAENGDGTRTDYWKQDLPHAPYLTMMAIGEYAIVKDQWRDKDVHYYIEEAYAPYARDIFGNTPEMIGFFSKILGVDYPWDKYHQVIVRDYVSGAMENTGAVIFGEFMNKTSRELLDGDNESIIAHELFHHWFGDLVTCESWANLPLNESFATYGEYLWIEFKYGRDAADHHLQGNLWQYLAESQKKQVDMIRFDYEDKEDMFDNHSYAKGGRILHMLRKYVGDEAFFESLRVYLETNKFSSVEIHDLRLAFEKVTGEDLNWFFNQWFLSSGHPELLVNTAYDEENKQAVVQITQTQNLGKTPLHRLPLEIDIYVKGEKQRKKVIAKNQAEKFYFDVDAKPDLINVDAEKMLLCIRRDNKSPEEWAFQFQNAPLYIDRYEALEYIGNSTDSIADVVLFEALNDPYHAIRIMAMKNSERLVKNNKNRLKENLASLAKADPKPAVRAGAIRQLATLFKGDQDIYNIFIGSTKDSSYMVIGEALASILVENEKEALKLAKSMENERNTGLLTSIAAIYAKAGDDSHNGFFLNSSKYFTGFSKYSFMAAYGKYLKNRSDETINAGLPMIEDFAKNSKAWWMRMSGIQVLLDLNMLYDERIQAYGKDLKTMEAGTPEESAIKNKIAAASGQKDKLKAVLANLKENETNENLLKVLESY